jgi:hypothetical protein
MDAEVATVLHWGVYRQLHDREGVGDLITVFVGTLCMSTAVVPEEEEGGKTSAVEWK